VPGSEKAGAGSPIFRGMVDGQWWMVEREVREAKTIFMNHHS